MAKKFVEAQIIMRKVVVLFVIKTSRKKSDKPVLFVVIQLLQSFVKFVNKHFCFQTYLNISNQHVPFVINMNLLLMIKQAEAVMTPLGREGRDSF